MTTGQARVGVVMAARNSADYITIALRSLIAQTLTDWMCVVVDDGSTDGTADVVAQLAADEPRIRLLRRGADGVSAARNAGLAALPAEVGYISLLDSDDAYLPHALEALADLLDRRPDAVGAYGLAEYVDEDGRPFRAGEHPAVQRGRRAVRQFGLVDVHPGADSTFADISVINAIWPSAVGLHRRSVIDAVGHFDASFTRQGDRELYLRMSRVGAFAVLDEQVAWYRRHASNLTGDVLESCYQQERVRHKAWKHPGSTPEQRRVIVRGTRRLQLADVRRLGGQVSRDLAERRVRHAAQDAFGLALVALTLLSPHPPRPSRARVRAVQRDQIDSRGTR